MNSEIIGALIASAAAIISAIIGGWVAIKVKDMELKAKEEKTGLPTPKTERKSSQWIWGIGGAIIGVAVVLVILFFINGLSIIPSPEPTAIVNETNTPSPTPTISVTKEPSDTNDGPTETPTPVPTNTSTSTPKPPTPTSTPTSTPKPPTPTNTPKPTNTPRPTPTATATIDADPTVYDNFNNPAFDGKLNESLWVNHSDDAPTQVIQENEMLIITNSSGAGDIVARKNNYVNLENFTSNVKTFFEVKLMSEAGVKGNVHTKISIDVKGGQSSFTECGIYEGNWAMCFLAGSYHPEGKSVDSGSWHTFRIELDPATMTFSYYIDGQQVGFYTPANAENLKGGKFNFKIGVYASENEPVSGYFDNVRMGQMQ